MTTKELGEIRKILSDLQTKINNIENKIPAINTISEILKKFKTNSIKLMNNVLMKRKGGDIEGI